MYEFDHLTLGVNYRLDAGFYILDRLVFVASGLLGVAVDYSETIEHAVHFGSPVATLAADWLRRCSHRTEVAETPQSLQAGVI